jgi:hypothetical protein
MEKNMTRKKPVYWTGSLPATDDFGSPYNTIMIDGVTKQYGSWANMNEHSWRVHGIGQFGMGKAQMYEKQPDGRWLKIKG